MGGALLLGLLAGALCLLLRRRRGGKGAAGLPRVSTGAPNGNGMAAVPDKDSAEGWQPALQRQLLPVRYLIKEKKPQGDRGRAIIEGRRKGTTSAPIALA